MKLPILLIVVLILAATGAVAELPDGYWSEEQTRPILDTMLRVTLDPDLKNLTQSELRALDELLAAGRIMHQLYAEQRHAQAASALQALESLHASSGRLAATQNLRDLFYVSKGPIVTTLDNERLPFLPVAAEQPGKNVYPDGLEREEIDAWLANNPAAAERLLDVRSVVRRATSENLAADLARLTEHLELDALHPDLRQRLEQTESDDGFYAVPYALAYAPRLRTIKQHLDAAADTLKDESPDFAAYLRNRGRDLLTGDYESGDAAWVSGEFAGLNVQIGSYETYDDNLLGVKAFYSASIMARDEAKSRELEAAIAELQSIENSLPYDHQKIVRSRIPVGVYKVIADFGQARGANTATILPNNADYARKYGRTILMRYNILTNPELFANRKQRFDAVADAAYRDDLTAEGGFSRTLWHEVGHYLGVSKTADGRELDAALVDHASLFEELKADLVSLFAATALLELDYHDTDSLRAHYSDGIRRTLQDVKPRAEQAYQTMQLLQFNFFMEYGLLGADPVTGLLTVDYDRYHEVVTAMLREVLQIQYSGDYELADEFVNRWNYWEEALHGHLVQRMRDSGSYRRTMVRYAALSE